MPNIKGLLVLNVASEGIARAAIEDDLSVENGTFADELHPINVFNSGCSGRATWLS